jgi:hypothetical protein
MDKSLRLYFISFVVKELQHLPLQQLQQLEPLQSAVADILAWVLEQLCLIPATLTTKTQLGPGLYPQI